MMVRFPSQKKPPRHVSKVTKSFFKVADEARKNKIVQRHADFTPKYVYERDISLSQPKVRY